MVRLLPTDYGHLPNQINNHIEQIKVLSRYVRSVSDAPNGCPTHPPNWSIKTSDVRAIASQRHNAPGLLRLEITKQRSRVSGFVLGLVEA